MTPEERIDRIERALDRHIEFVGQEIEKNTAGIRDLIIVSRTVLTSIQEMRQAHEKDYEELRRTQAATDEKLNILIDTVDRLIRHRNGNREPS